MPTTGEPQQRQRYQRAAQSRRRLQITHTRVFADAIGRILRREANDVGNAARRMLGERSLAEFDQWLREFYRSHMTFSREQLAPVASAYMELVARDAMQETGTEVDEERVERFIASYLAAFASRHATKQEERVRDLMAEGAEELLPRLEKELERWREESRAQTEAQNETVRSGNAVASTVYILAGVTVLRWSAFGKSCPYCTALNGRTVAINEVFIPAGTNFEPDGADSPLVVSTNIGHPPAHLGCDCVVLAGG